MNKFEQKFRDFLLKHGWEEVKRPEMAPMWRHDEIPSRRFDTACAISEALKLANSTNMLGG